MKDKLIDILGNEKTDEIIPFLKSLNDNERKSLVPAIKSKLKEYTEVDPKHEYGTFVGSMNQFTIISIAAFVCLNFNDYKRNRIQISYLTDGFIKFHEYSQQELMKKIHIDDILEWYCPEWINEYVNSSRLNEEFKCAEYLQLIQWFNKGYITLSPELIVATLSRSLLDSYYDYEMHYSFHPERLQENEITLKEHIWLLFEYPSLICYNMYYGGNKNQNWIAVFKSLSEKQHIDRMQLLKQTLLTSDKNFIKNLIGWFVDLFNELKPTKEELIQLQAELFSSLTSPQSKAVSNALNHIKTICTSDEFRRDDFLAYMPTLLSSTTKGIVIATLDIAEKLLKQQNNNDICIALCAGFVSKDESIQKKIAKLLTAYGQQETLKPHLSIYSDNILMSVQPLLKDMMSFSSSDAAPETVLEANDFEEPVNSIQNENRIQWLSSFDDYIFFMNQAFDNNNVHDLLFIPVYIQQFHNQITAENLHQFEPTFKKAVSVQGNWSDKIGLTGKLFAVFFIRYMEYLAAKYPGASSNIEQQIKKKDYLSFVHWQSQITHLETYPYYYILLNTFDCIKKGEHFNLLSKPTHSPLWIDPVVLVQRLSTYQSQGKRPQTYDLQFAIQQCALYETSEALDLARKELNGELRDLMVYLFDKNTEAKAKVEHPSWWMTAAITKSPHTIPSHTKEWGFSDIPAEYLTGRFKWEMKENKDGYVNFDIKLPVWNAKDHEKGIVAQFIYGRFRNTEIWGGDVMLLIDSSPYNHDSIVAHILTQIVEGSMMDSPLRSELINALTSLFELQLPLSYTDRLLLAICLVSPDKTVKHLAAEVWISVSRKKNIQNETFGKELGAILQQKWSPVKRLTDLIEGNILNTDPLINALLEDLLTSVLSEIKTPITNLKKLLEIYNELLALNNSRASLEEIPQLDDWLQENSLKKVVKQIIG